MEKVRFIGENLVDEDGKVVISAEDLVSKCMVNVAYSHSIIEIVKYTIRSLGYELVNNKTYRRSSLFNKVEDTILKSGLYIVDRNKRPRSGKPNPADKYIAKIACEQKMCIAHFVSKRPQRFSHKEW